MGDLIGLQHTHGSLESLNNFSFPFVFLQDTIYLPSFVAVYKTYWRFLSVFAYTSTWTGDLLHVNGEYGTTEPHTFIKNFLKFLRVWTVEMEEMWDAFWFRNLSL